jgi:hypothetical protein
MTVIKKASIEAVASEQDAQEITQPHVTTGFETCQDIQTIKEELARLDDIMKRTSLENEYSRSAVRYWAIRWVMGWESEIPNV